MVHYKLCYFNVRGKAEGIRYIFAQAGVDFEDHRVSHDEWPKLKPSRNFSFHPMTHGTPIDMYCRDLLNCTGQGALRKVLIELGKFTALVDLYVILYPSADTPMGQLPVLHIDNKVLCQSMAIARYIAKEYGLIPSNHFLAAKADMIVDGLGDQYPNIRPYMMALMKGDADEAAKLWDAYKKENLSGFLDMYEKFLTEAGGKYFAGDHVLTQAQMELSNHAIYDDLVFETIDLCWADLLVAELLDRLIQFNKSDSILTGHKHLAQLVKHVHELPNIKKYLASRPQTAM